MWPCQDAAADLSNIAGINSALPRRKKGQTEISMMVTTEPNMKNNDVMAVEHISSSSDDIKKRP